MKNVVSVNGVDYIKNSRGYLIPVEEVSQSDIKNTEDIESVFEEMVSIISRLDSVQKKCSEILGENGSVKTFDGALKIVKAPDYSRLYINGELYCTTQIKQIARGLE